jgi:pilus assembly protein Flp/PilA
MLATLKNVRRLFADKKGVTAIEYGLIAGAIGVAIIVAVTTVGTDLNTLFGTVGTKLNTANTTAGN